MQLRRLAALERKKIEDELAEARKRIKYFEELLRSPKKILGVIQTECNDLKERFGDARRTFIAATTETEFREEGHGEEGEALVTLSRDGVMRRAPTSQYRRTRSDAKSGVHSREDDPVEHLFIASTHDNLVLLTNRGRALPFRMSQVPDVTRNPSGVSLANQLESGERLIAALPVNGNTATSFITMATSGGKIKRTALEEFANLQSGGVRAINLGEGDELGWARMTQGGGELLLVTAQGQALRFEENDVPVQGRVAAGVNSIKLADGDKVVALERVEKDGWLVVASAKGFAKRVALKEFSTRGRYTQGMTAFPPDAKTGPVAAARVVDLAEDVMILSQNGVVVRVRVENIVKANRGARGKQIVTLKESDAIVALTSLVGRVEGSSTDAESEVPTPSKVQKSEEPTPTKARGNGHAPAADDGPVRKAKAETKPALPAPKSKETSSRASRAAAPREEKVGADSTLARSGKSSGDGERSSEKQMEIPFASFKPLPKKK